VTENNRESRAPWSRNGRIAGEVHVLGRAHELATTGERDLYTAEGARLVHATYGRGAEVAAAVAGKHLVAGRNVFDRLRRPVGHRHLRAGDEALIQVTHDHDAAVLGGEGTDELPLRGVGVLEL